MERSARNALLSVSVEVVAVRRSTPSTTTRACLLIVASLSFVDVPFTSSRRRLQVTEKAVEDYRRQIDDRKPENYGFASMAAVPYAHIVANILKDKKYKGTEVILAPNPKDIVSQSHLPFHYTFP